jgi:hypothetical protein
MAASYRGLETAGWRLTLSKPAAALTLWLGKGNAEFSSLQERDLTPLLSACAGNTILNWLKAEVRSELGKAESNLSTI